MFFNDETSAIISIADYISAAASGLFKTTKYLYVLGSDKFYQCDIKDVFRVVLNNLREPERLEAFHLTNTGPYCAAMETPAYAAVADLILYSFAARIPVLTKPDCGLSDEQALAVYDTVMLGHAVNPGGFVQDSFEDIRRRVKKRRPLPPYKTDWFRTYLYSRCPALAELSNRNVFLMGTAEPLFSMFYLQLEAELKAYILRLSRS